MSIQTTELPDEINMGEAAYGGPRVISRRDSETRFDWSIRVARSRSKFNAEWDQRRQTEADEALPRMTTIRVSGLTPTQAFLIEDELNRIGCYLADAGKTWVEGPRWVLFHVAEGLESTWPDDEELAMRIEANANRDLSEAQVAFGVKQINLSMKLTVKKMRKAARKV